MTGVADRIRPAARAGWENRHARAAIVAATWVLQPCLFFVLRPTIGGLAVATCALPVCTTVLAYGRRYAAAVGGVFVVGIVLGMVGNTLDAVQSHIGSLTGSTQPLPWGIGLGAVAVLSALAGWARDMRQSNVEQALRLRELALKDPLTGLANRRLFDDRLERAVALSVRARDPVAVLYIDMDNFKDVNDRHGHAAGDALLQHVAEVLSESVARASDTVARLGGDEFGILLPDTAMAGAQRVADRITDALDRGMGYGVHEVPSAASIGIAIAPEHGATGSLLLVHADQAMYLAKQRRCGAVVWQPEGLEIAGKAS